MWDKKRIAFVSNSLWSIFHFRINIIRLLINKGFDVTVLAPPDDSFIENIAAEKLNFIPLKHLHPRKMLPWQEIQLFDELKKHYTALRPDLVFHYTIKPNIIGSMAAGAAKVKSVAVITGLGYTLVNNRVVSFFVRPLYRMALQHPEEVWFLNEGDREFFVSAKMTPFNKTFILPGEGVDTNFFTPAKHNSKNNTALRFLMISRILNNKGVNEFVEAAQRLAGQHPGIQFILMGKHEPDGPDAVPKVKLAEWAQKNSIIYLPYSKEVRDEIAKADCVVLPSYAEGLSVSLMEAAAMAKPLIASDVNGCRELVIDNQSGYLCRPRDVNDLVEKMEKLISLSKEARLAMGNNGRKLIIEKYAVDIINEIYLRKINVHLQAG